MKKLPLSHAVAFLWLKTLMPSGKHKAKTKSNYYSTT